MKAELKVWTKAELRVEKSGTLKAYWQAPGSVAAKVLWMAALTAYWKAY